MTISPATRPVPLFSIALALVNTVLERTATSRRENNERRGYFHHDRHPYIDSDLIWDRKSLDGYNGPFLYIIRERGTHVVTVRSLPSDSTNAIVAYRDIVAGRCYSDVLAVFLISERGDVREITGHANIERVTADYMRNELGWTDAPARVRS